MDVVSVLGPTGSLGSLISATGMLSKELYSLAHGVKAAKKDIRKFARKLFMFSWTSNEACSCLLHHYSKETGLETFSNAKKRRFLRRAEESANEILEDVKNISPRIMSMEPSGIELSLISKIRWYQRKSEVRDLTFEMGALQTSLALLMSTVTYEVQIRNNADPETLALTMTQITNFIEGAEIMASKFEKLADGQRAADKTIKRLSMLLGNMIDVADRQLDDADEAREATGLYEPGRWVRRKQVDARSLTDTDLDIPAASQGKGKGKGRQTNREPPEASSSRGVQNPGDASGPENVRSTQPPSTRFPEGANLKYCIAPGAADVYESINGQISKGKSRSSRSSSRTVTARLYPKFGVNAISRDLAEKLGLEITDFSNRFYVEVLSDIGSTQAQVNDTVGEVSFVWHTPTHSHRRVICTVFEQEIVPGVPLTLGRPYARQLETAGRNVRGESSRAGAAS